MRIQFILEVYVYRQGLWKKQYLYRDKLMKVFATAKILSAKWVLPAAPGESLALRFS